MSFLDIGEMDQTDMPLDQNIQLLEQEIWVWRQIVRNFDGSAENRTLLKDAVKDLNWKAWSEAGLKDLSEKPFNCIVYDRYVNKKRYCLSFCPYQKAAYKSYTTTDPKYRRYVDGQIVEGCFMSDFPGSGCQKTRCPPVTATGYRLTWETGYTLDE